MSTPYGTPSYGRGAYGGRTSKYSPVGTTLQVFDKTGAVKGWYQSGIGEYIGCVFTADESGSRDFTLYFGAYVNIGKTDIIKIFVFDHDDAFFTGVVRIVPVKGSTSQAYQYEGFGLIDYLERISTEAQTYTGETLYDIVEDLLDTRIIPNSVIIKNPVKLQIPTTIITEIVFDYGTCKEALDDLLKFANAEGDYIYGVDESGEFFFKPRSEEVVTLVVGANGRNGIAEYQPEDADEPKSRIYVFRKDGTFYAQYSTTDGTIDINQVKVDAPQIDDADIDTWAEGQLAVLERQTIQAEIEWQIETIAPTKLLADGNVRVICNRPPTLKQVTGTAYGAGAYGSGYYGGALEYSGYSLDDTLKVKEVSYTINDQQASRKITLGSVPVTLDRELVAISKRVAQL